MARKKKHDRSVDDCPCEWKPKAKKARKELDGMKRKLAGDRGDEIDLDEIAKLLGVETPDDWMDGLETGTGYDLEYAHAKREGLTDEKADERAYKAEDEERWEYYREYVNAIMHVADNLFEQHGMVLDPIDSDTAGINFHYAIRPEGTWEDVAAEIINTINGVGMFYYESVEEFIDVGPYETAQEAVMAHLGVLPDYYRVMGEPSPQRQIERHMR